MIIHYGHPGRRFRQIIPNRNPNASGNRWNIVRLSYFVVSCLNAARCTLNKVEAGKLAVVLFRRLIMRLRGCLASPLRSAFFVETEGERVKVFLIDGSGKCQKTLARNR